ncbi:MAG: Fe-S cluster assembly ATPase SufC [Candidatus Dadabacteria bacterium]|nr:MAG: Fe-S cluster assembly ATPase SufC [Candidatus Dadabacteria bacterium]
MLEIQGLRAAIDGTEILHGIDLTIRPGEVHAIMGPNGSGKSTLAQVIAGNDRYEVLDGKILFFGEDLLEMDPEERAREGVFLAFQQPVAIPGISNSYFLKAALNEVREHRGLPELDAAGFLKLAREKMKLVQMPKELLNRPVNDGFSGGERKRNEIFQMAMLEPRLAVLDEIDSGLDIDALRTISDGVNALRDGERMFLMITHYQRLLEYIVPDVVHVLAAGRVIRSGDRSLAEQLEARGYNWVLEEAGVALS